MFHTLHNGNRGVADVICKICYNLTWKISYNLTWIICYKLTWIIYKENKTSKTLKMLGMVQHPLGGFGGSFLNNFSGCSKNFEKMKLLKTRLKYVNHTFKPVYIQSTTMWKVIILWYRYVYVYIYIYQNTLFLIRFTAWYINAQPDIKKKRRQPHPPHKKETPATAPPPYNYY